MLAPSVRRSAIDQDSPRTNAATWKKNKRRAGQVYEQHTPSLSSQSVNRTVIIALCLIASPLASIS